jgi:hypothetical protein
MAMAKKANRKAGKHAGRRRNAAGRKANTRAKQGLRRTVTGTSEPHSKQSTAGIVVSVEQEIAQTHYNGPHVVILGAGASRAACPQGDANGKLLPVMKDFLHIVELGDLPDVGDREDFEAVYSKLVSDPAHADRCNAIEKTIYDYFASMCLPPTPTIYDYLVLSLRRKDVIATFNWDPFLVQAMQRCYPRGEAGPCLLFLHGNVLAGYCAKDKRLGPTNASCSVCGEPFTPSRLLYPVVEKRYDEDPLIAEDWATLRQALKQAFWVTIFGYSAPKSDVAARELLLEAWGGAEERSLEQIELIDIRDEADLLATWAEFIHSHHYDVHKSFFDSWIAKHPRRTGEAYRNLYMEAKFIHPNPVPQDATLDALRTWYGPLKAAEARSSSPELDR